MPITRGQAATGFKPGTVGTFAFNDTDPAWFDCDGAAKNVADEPALFAAIGYTYGGDGAVFNLPNYNDDFLRGGHAGRPVGTREADAFQGHEHGYNDPSSAGGGGYPGAGSDGSYQTTDSIEEKGGFGVPRVATETRPRNVAAKFRIKR